MREITTAIVFGTPYGLKASNKPHTFEAVSQHGKLTLPEEAAMTDRVERECEQKRQLSETLVLFPIRLDDAVMHTKTAWAGDIRRIRFMGNFRQWQDRVAYQRALQRLLHDVRA